jgi:hypothetical protein
MSSEESWAGLIAMYIGVSATSILLDIVVQFLPFSPWVDSSPNLQFVLVGALLSLPWMVWLARKPYDTDAPSLTDRLTRHFFPLAILAFFGLGGRNVMLQLNASLDRSPIETHEVEVVSINSTKDLHTFVVSSWRSEFNDVTETIHWREGWSTTPVVTPRSRLRVDTRRGRFGFAWVSAATVVSTRD